MGSVSEIGDKVRVNVRMVETSKSEVLLNESVSIDRGAFVRKARRYVKITHTISAGYLHQFIDDFRVHTFYALYTYDFFHGLALNLQLFYGFSDTMESQTEEGSGLSIYTSTFEKSFAQIGLNILLSRSFDILWGFSLVPYAGPSLLFYMESNDLESLQLSGSPPYDIKTSGIYPSYFLFGIKAGIMLQYRFTPSYRIFMGFDYQYFPSFEIKKFVNYELSSGGTPPSAPLFITWEDTIKLSGYSILAGVSYSF